MMRSVLHILVARYSVFSQVCLQFSSGVVRHGFDVKSCCGLPGHERKKNRTWFEHLGTATGRRASSMLKSASSAGIETHQQIEGHELGSPRKPL